MNKSYESPNIEIINIEFDILTDSGFISGNDIPEGSDPYAM